MAKKSSKNKEKIRQLSDADIAGEVGVSFSLEEDAEQLFKSAVEKLSAHSLPPSMQKMSDDERAQARAVNKTAALTTLDLHGLRVEEALRLVEATIGEKLLGKGQQFQLRIITGKGLHSGPSGGVLIREVYDFIRRRYARAIVRIDEPPAYATVGGVPLKGHFEVTFRRS